MKNTKKILRKNIKKTNRRKQLKGGSMASDRVMGFPSKACDFSNDVTAIVGNKNINTEFIYKTTGGKRKQRGGGLPFYTDEFSHNRGYFGDSNSVLGASVPQNIAQNVSSWFEGTSSFLKTPQSSPFNYSNIQQNCVGTSCMNTNIPVNLLPSNSTVHVPKIIESGSVEAKVFPVPTNACSTDSFVLPPQRAGGIRKKKTLLNNRKK
jgi:hypothetical protein